VTAPPADGPLRRFRRHASYLRLMVANGAAAATLARWAMDGLRARRRRGSAEARRATAEFTAGAANGDFTSTWFDDHIPEWAALLEPLRRRGAPLRVLEIGSWEGRSTLFLLTYLPTATVTAVDTWDGAGGSGTAAEAARAEARFDTNLARFGERLVKLKGRSSIHLPKLAAEAPASFDLVYVDGSHDEDDVMADALLAWRLLRSDGIVVFDDYLWVPDAVSRQRGPCRAINRFLRLVKRECRVLHCGWQVSVLKTGARTAP